MLTGQGSWQDLSDTASGLLETVEGVNRCIWNLGERAPEHVQLLAATMTRERLDLLREADHVVMEALRRHGVHDAIWQCPTVLLPLELDGAGTEFVVVRPILSERAMTATAAELPLPLLRDIAETVLKWPEISGLGLDLTSKPPGTVEWE